MFDKILQIWKDTEEKLPGFRYFTAAFLIVIALGYLVLNYLSKDYWWTVIPGFFLVLLAALFVWLVLTLINPPAGPDEITKGMRRFLVRFVLFLFVGFVLTIITLSATLALWQQPAAICRELGCVPPPSPPDDHSVALAHAILKNAVSADWDHANTKIFSDANAMDGFLGRYGCRYCRLNAYQGLCPPDFTAGLCSASATAVAAAQSGSVSRMPHLHRQTGSCARKNLTRAASPGRILGIDLSHIDHDVDFGALEAKGVYFVYLKASQGSHFLDAAFAQRWKAAGEAGLIRGAYHTFTTDPADSQAALFLSAMSHVEYGPCDLGPALDLGIAQNLSPPNAPAGALSSYLKNAVQWLGVVKQKTAGSGGRAPTPIVYASAGSVPDGDPSAQALAAYPLWFGNYAVIGSPSPPAAWGRYTFRQFTDGHIGQVIAGLPYDASEFNGTPVELLRLTR
jgi:lysozyme